MIETIRPLIAKHLNRILSIRWDIHKNPELSKEEKRTAETLNKLQRGDVTLAAYRAAGKQEAINGEAGPDYDEPA